MKGIQYALLPVIFFITVDANGQLWKQYEDSAINNIAQRNSINAIQYYILSRNSYKKKKNQTDSTYMRISYKLAALYTETDEYTQAIDIYEELTNSISKSSGKSNLNYINASFSLADAYITTADYRKAEEFLLDCKNLIPQIQGDNRLLFGEVCNTLAILYRTTAQYDKSEKNYIETLDILEKLGNQDIPYVMTIGNLGVMYMFIGRYEDSEKCMLKAKELKKKLFGIGHKEYARTLNTIGLLYTDMGKYNEAEPLFVEARKILENNSTKDKALYATFTFNLAEFYRQTGKYDKAELLNMEAKAINEKLFTSPHPAIARSISNLGMLYFELGQYDKAISNFEEAKRLFKLIYSTNHPEYANASRHLAGSYLNIKKYPEAEALANEAKTIVDNLPGRDPLTIIPTNNLLFGIYFLSNRYQEAETIGLKNLALIDSNFGRNHRFYIIASSNMGGLYEEMNDYAKAERFYEQAYKACETVLGQNHLNFANIASQLGGLYWGKGDMEKADTFFTNAWRSIQSQINQQFVFQNEMEKAHFINLVKEKSEQLYSFYTTKKDAAFSNNSRLLSHSLNNRSRLFNSLFNLRESIFMSPDRQLQQEYTQWIDTKEQLAFWLSKPVREREGRDKELEEKANGLEKKLTISSNGFNKYLTRQVTTWQNIQQSLILNEASIEFAEFQYFNGKKWTDSTYYIALILRKDKPKPELVQLFEKKELDSVLSNTKSIDKEKTINLRYARDYSLYKLIWQPLEKHLKGIQKIYFAPSGMLHKIPVAALPVNDKERLSDKYKLIQLNTTASVVKPSAESISITDKLFLYGGILYDGDTTALRQAAVQYNMKDMVSRSLPEDLDRGNIWQYLEKSRTEVENIEKMARQKAIPVSLSTGWDATEESVKSLKGKNSPSILHIATHGFFYPDPQTKPDKSVATEGKVFRQSDNPLLRSGLTMAGANFTWNGKPVKGIEDGILTAYEVSNLYLPNTKLAVLSACETGLGDIQGSEGVYGLQRAFKIAGVKNLVMSLWDVPDAATAEFMTDFYKNMFAGQTIEDAFYNTQTAMKNKYRNEPYKWAAWVLIR